MSETTIIEANYRTKLGTKMHRSFILGISLWFALFSAVYLGVALFSELRFSYYSVPLVSFLIWICVVDTAQLRIPNGAILSIVALGIVYLSFEKPELVTVHLMASTGILVSTYLVLKIIAFFSENSGFGNGDVKLVAASTIWLGIPTIFTAIFVALSSGLIVAMVSILAGKETINSRRPFGPFLSLGLWYAWLTTQI